MDLKQCLTQGQQFLTIIIIILTSCIPEHSMKISGMIICTDDIYDCTLRVIKWLTQNIFSFKCFKIRILHFFQLHFHSSRGGWKNISAFLKRLNLGGNNLLLLLQRANFYDTVYKDLLQINK